MSSRTCYHVVWWKCYQIFRGKYAHVGSLWLRQKVLMKCHYYSVRLHFVVPEDSILHGHCHRKIKFHISLNVLMMVLQWMKLFFWMLSMIFIQEDHIAVGTGFSFCLAVDRIWRHSYSLRFLGTPTLILSRSCIQKPNRVSSQPVHLKTEITPISKTLIFKINKWDEVENPKNSLNIYPTYSGHFIWHYFMKDESASDIQVSCCKDM